MKTRIKLKTCFALPGLDSDMMSLPEDVKTIADLLHFMGIEMDYSFIEPETGNPEEDIEIIINGKEVWFYPTSLDTPLKDGDTIEIYLLPLGGG